MAVAQTVDLLQWQPSFPQCTCAHTDTLVYEIGPLMSTAPIMAVTPEYGGKRMIRVL